MSYVKFTKTSSFLFPLLEIPKTLFNCNVSSTFKNTIMTNRFLNSYLIDKDLNCDFNKDPFLFIVIKPYRDKDFQSFFDTLVSLDNYVDDYEKEDFITLIFEVKEKKIPDYNLIIEGKYSKISKESKKLILNNSFFRRPEVLPLILSKSTELKKTWEARLSSPKHIVDLKDQEVWGILNKEEESFSCETLRELKKTKLKLTPNQEFR